MNAELIGDLTPTLKAYAYNICGSVADAEDVVQDVLLKFLDVDQQHIDNVKAYLIRMVINRAIDQKKKLHRLVLDYPGEWLPEPVAAEKADAGINRKELLSYSLMVLLEKLNPRQRAVFILKEAFDYEHTEIAEVLAIKPDLSRQLLTRAKKSIGAPGLHTGNTVPEAFLNKYLHVLQSGSMEQLEALLNEDVVSVSDGGGKARAAVKPVYGKKSVAALLLGLYRKFNEQALVRQGWANGQPALLYFSAGQLIKCVTFTFQEGRISQAYIIRNPDKLKNLN
ncbi:RNA polymerase sigma factor (sigma-70 family) [Pedobacter africanus]|uniref:RNA polymerase sigma-70 factor (ECF subfamily) n=1 Tax=Pedobacter africanus TaxID=151894 RepID=A0ACC6KVL5_9SPHI|nr:sigma-70 family RNA polymerase sigma factor [Pedobacter africanus]MDR6783195.1 RNA polymerase sigma-70 factor (ECF subfamily) [Pedobacter africanus]